MTAAIAHDTTVFDLTGSLLGSRYRFEIAPRGSSANWFVLTFGFGSGSRFGSRFAFGDMHLRRGDMTNNEPQTSKARRGIPDRT